MTINEIYYAMNTALNVALKSYDVSARVYKYGAVPSGAPHPYFQTSYRVKSRQPYGTKETGTLTDFEFTLNFFTAAGTDEVNDADLFIPFEAARELVTSRSSNIWNGVANVLSHDETPRFDFKGGQEVLQRGLVFDCQAVVSHVLDIPAGEEITVDEVVETIKNSLSEE